MKGDNHETIPEPRWRKISQWIFFSIVIILAIVNLIYRINHGGSITPRYFYSVTLVAGLGAIIFAIIDYVNKFYTKKSEIIGLFLSGIFLILIGILDFIVMT